MKAQIRFMIWSGLSLIMELRMRQGIRLTGLRAMRITMELIPDYLPIHLIIGIIVTVILLIYQDLHILLE